VRARFHALWLAGIVLAGLLAGRAFAASPTYYQKPTSTPIATDLIIAQPYNGTAIKTYYAGDIAGLAASNSAVIAAINTAIAAYTGPLTTSQLNLTNVSGTQCLHSVAGVVSGAGADCGAGSFSPATAYNWTALQTLSAGANITPACPAATNAVGYLGAPQNTQGAYTFVCSDAGKIVECSSSCGTWTIPANSAVAYPIGTIIALDNETSSTIALAINTDTLNYGASTGSQVIPAQTVGTIVKIGTTSWRLNLPAGSVPTGTVAFYAANSAPSGWLIENGAAVSRTTYAALFAVIGTTYGAGDGSTTFNLPNMLGQFVRGFDSSGSVDPGRTFGSTEAYAVGPHNHLNGMTQTTGSGSLMVYGTSTTGIPGSAVDTVHADANTPVNQGYTSTSTGTESRPTNVALTPIIKTAFHPVNDNHPRPRLIAA
jgi:microcystin-dependent protein